VPSVISIPLSFVRYAQGTLTMKQLKMFANKQRVCAACRVSFVPLYGHDGPLCPECLRKLTDHLAIVVSERGYRHGKGQ
jgi:predicted amidophosphoribosyltransferase